MILSYQINHAMKRFIATLMLFTSFFMTQIPLAGATASVLPDHSGGATDFTCDPEGDQTKWKIFLILVEAGPDADVGGGTTIASIIAEKGVSDPEVQDFFACAIKTGNVKFWMVPYYVTFALQFLISLSGLISVLFVLIGAYYYIAGGLNEDKEKGKTIITYALGGFVLVTLAWVIVNAVLLILTTS